MSSAEERERERLARVARNRLDAAPIVEALRDSGFAVETVADLFNKKLDYRGAIPILLDWLQGITNPDVKEDIVRALSVKWAKGTKAPKLLVTEFEQAEDSSGTGLRWAIGNALEALANDEITEPMIVLATDQRYGKAREMVVLGLGKLKDARVVDVLLNLLADEEVVGHAVMALGKLRARTARARIEPLLKHPKPWVRKEAKKALANIDKAR
jgi:HEAT repeat protein